ncbi:Mu transposase C-terminal domain-containing protein [uncultured Desulfovibrio sp.]|uniref:Mu transposase C-terminal domain-containing protein n=1 Tax=uncultured Desulfovibrio sp. TaxID=167968 RepID=UPI002619F43D|nr:Mu transposase C-terminal domain-containing protein [uncultured Desulfovibrio sp.]
MAVLKDYYTTRELAQMLGLTERAIQMRAKREGWQSIQRKERGGGKCWHASSTPKATRDLIASALLRQPAVPAASPAETPVCAHIDSNACAPIGADRNGPALSDRERAIVTARLAFCRELDRIVPLVGKKAAVEHLVTSSRLGRLAPVLMEQLAAAFARRRGDCLTTRTLYRWYAEYLAGGEAALAPQRATTKAPAWADEFLGLYQKPQHPSVVMAHQALCQAMRARGEEPPSIHACYRLLNKMSRPEREAGRATGNALLRLRPHQRRDTSELWPTDIYTADGTTFDAEVLHPGHGQPFKPEITAVLDVATRRCVGVSIALAESASGVLDAVRMACLGYGVPAFFYSDNGPGYVNRLLLDDRTGMFPRLGITPVNAIPGRPQGKGLMERAVGTLWVRAAQGLASYGGALMDRDAAKRNFKLSRAAIRQGKRAALPTWDEFKAHIAARIREYNAAPHRGLPRYRDAQGRLRHYSPDEYWQTFTARGFTPVRVPQDMEAEMFMPAEKRVTRNGWLQFYSGRYFAPELADFHGEAVEVRYDIWDDSRVWCWTFDGRRIGEARRDGNTRPYIERTRLEAAREKRARAQVRRLENRLQTIAPGASISLPPVDDAPVIDAAVVPPVPEDRPLPSESATHDAARPVFMTTYDRFRWLMAHDDRQTDADRAWLAVYRQGEEYADLRDLYAAQGFA